MSKISCCFLFFSLLLSFDVGVRGQWTNRYPKIANVSHHVYLEGYNLPTLNQSATDPTATPDGKTLAIAARLDLADGYGNARSETPDKKRRG